MKRAILIFLLLPFVLSANAQKPTHKRASVHTVTRAQPNGTELLKFFYTAYMEALTGSNPPSLTDARVRLLRRVYCTKRCLIRYDELTQQTDADPFVKAQGSNMEGLKSLQITKDKDPKRPNDYTVSYSVVDTKVEIKLRLVMENGKLKIDYLD